MARRAYDETEFTTNDLEDTVQQLHPELSRSDREALMYGDESNYYSNDEWVE